MVNLLLTEECNKNCSFCFAGPSSGKNSEHRDKITLSNVARFARWCRDNNVPRVGLLGGEPLTYHSFNEILEIFDRNNIDVKLVSNFTYPSPEKNLNHNRMVSYLLNTAALQSKNDLKRFKKNLMKLTPENRAKVSVGYTIASENEDFSDLREISNEFNLKSIRVDFATPSISDEKKDTLDNKAKKEMLQEVFEIARNNEMAISLDCNISTQIKALFSEEKRQEFIENDLIGFSHEKESCRPVLDVDVDLSVFHCFPLRDKKIDNILNHSLKEVKYNLAGQAQTLREGNKQEHCLAFNEKD